jgi:hypothetical protein
MMRSSDRIYSRWASYPIAAVPAKSLLPPRVPPRYTPPEDPMSPKSSQRAPMMSLKELVERYAAMAGNFGNPVELSAFGLSAEETQNLFSNFDEDYHISRFLHFSRDEGQSYAISAEEVTHVAIDPSIYSLL